MSNTQTDSSGVIKTLKEALIEKLGNKMTFNELMNKHLVWELEDTILHIYIAKKTRALIALNLKKTQFNIIQATASRVIPKTKIVFHANTRKEKANQVTVNLQQKLPGMEKEVIIPRLPPQKNLDSLSACGNNTLALSVCLNIINGKMKDEDEIPLVCLITGQTGRGKSHLLYAIAHEAIKSGNFKFPMLISATRFSQKMVQAIQRSSMDSFQAKYKQYDLFILDDIHMLGKKVKTQEELQILFEHFTQRRIPIMMASTMSQSTLETMSLKKIMVGANKDRPELGPEILSRILSGFVFEIEAPNFNDKKIIIQDILRRSSLTWSEEVINYLATNLNGDVRKIISAIINIKARTEFSRINPDLDLATKIISASKPSQSESVNLVIRTVAEKFDLTNKDLLSKGRGQKAKARQLASWLLVKHLGKTQSHVGRIFDQTPATIINSIKATNRALITNSEFKKMVDSLISQLKI